MHDETLLDRIVGIVGPNGVVREADKSAYESDWRGAYNGVARFVVRPANTAEVSQVVTLCSEAGIAIVPQGGNTGLCGGAVPDDSASQIVLSLTRMNRVRAVDPDNDTITVEAGVILKHLQDLAEEAGRFFPLSLGAEGSCTIGGNLATNAGGTAVLRYGNMRELTLGIEAVLPDGTVWHGLRALRKDNTGYDLKQLFIGAEGTLGVITAAVLRMFPRPKSIATAWVALSETSAAIRLIRRIQSLCGDRLTGFELMSAQSVEFVTRHLPGCKNPLEHAAPWYALIELSDTQTEARLGDLLEEGLAGAFDAGDVQDAVVANSETQVEALWALREGISEAQNHEGPSLKHDISIAVSQIPAFIEKADARLNALLPKVRLVTYGHVGDGNLHYNVSKPVDVTAEAFKEHASAITDAIYEVTASFDGSISAEHGIGIAKREAAKRHKDPIELGIMRALKNTLDPKGLMNPGKML
ncbi:FAD-binding oxidoreductase [Pseudomonas matsuisoli]|uniref:D-2-hydroxyacid dehydrogenase n=1 Tax=Pseudomonas matsuisoli TaxID=1515666 RepID=A0A917PR15_9PSED|nr:FAD-binding oxidoreductase [Pseudomonas matsuisoli]GGJ88124.1 D-2-hydroxyacid dehydrogenase [Pseudomonas matsuisoli]